MLKKRRHNAIRAVAKELGEARFHREMQGGHGFNATLDPAKVIQIIFGGNLQSISAMLQTGAKVAESKMWKRNKR